SDIQKKENGKRSHIRAFDQTPPSSLLHNLTHLIWWVMSSTTLDGKPYQRRVFYNGTIEVLWRSSHWNKVLRTHHLTSGSRDIWQIYCKKIEDQEEVRKKESLLSSFTVLIDFKLFGILKDLDVTLSFSYEDSPSVTVIMLRVNKWLLQPNFSVLCFILCFVLCFFFAFVICVCVLERSMQNQKLSFLIFKLIKKISYLFNTKVAMS
ncbi:hypothetical protein HID58_061968, partial [Brassica napus]